MFKEEVWEFITECLKNKPLLESHFGTFPLQGVSGNRWRPDIVIVSTQLRVIDGVKLIAEMKIQDYEGKRPTLNTYKEHMWRAYARLGDMKDWQVPKYVLFPYLVEGKGAFDFNAYFRTIDVILLDWSKTEHVEKLKKQIDKL